MFEEINLLYSQALLKHGDSASAVLIPKDNQHLRFASLLKFMPHENNLAVLDYGCGLAHLKEYLSDNFNLPFIYTGVEINADFLEHNRQKYKDTKFVNRENFFSNEDSFDIVVSIGTFNLVYKSDLNLSKDFVYEEIMRLWTKTRRTLYLNFMSHLVDFQQPLAYHQNVGEVFDFCVRNLSRYLHVDASYLPYEFSLIVERRT